MDFLDDDAVFHDAGGARNLTIAAVMRAWHDRAWREPPWRDMPLDDRAGGVRRVAEALLDVTGGLECSIRQRDIRIAAALHGHFRREQGCAARIIGGDFTLLRLAVKLALYHANVPAAATRRFIRCVLPDWRMARRLAEFGHLGYVSERSRGSSSD